MKLVVLEIAQLELDEGFLYYESEQAGLGYRFVGQVSLAIDRLQEFPKAYQLFSPSTRRCLVEGFPHGILYQYNESGSEIVVAAVGHLHRAPEYWISRI